MESPVGQFEVKLAGGHLPQRPEGEALEEAAGKVPSGGGGRRAGRDEFGQFHGEGLRAMEGCGR